MRAMRIRSGRAWGRDFSAALVALALGWPAAARVEARDDVWYGRSAADTAFLLGFSVSFGGREFNHPNEPSNTDAALGDGVAVLAGLMQPLNAIKSELVLAVGQHLGLFSESILNGDDVDISMRFPFAEASVLAKLATHHRFGVGLTRHFSPKVEFDFGSNQENGMTLHDANGAFVEYRYASRPSPASSYRTKLDISLRYTLVDYRIETLDGDPMLPDTVDPDFESKLIGLQLQFLF